MLWIKQYKDRAVVLLSAKLGPRKSTATLREKVDTVTTSRWIFRVIDQVQLALPPLILILIETQVGKAHLKNPSNLTQSETERTSLSTQAATQLPRKQRWESPMNLISGLKKGWIMTKSTIKRSLKPLSAKWMTSFKNTINKQTFTIRGKT